MLSLPAADVLVDGVGKVGMLLLLTEEEDLCREGVGWVAPVNWCVGLGSEISMGSNEAEVELEETDALLATDADWARRAVSSRVRRLTCVLTSVSMSHVVSKVERQTYHRLLLLLTFQIQLGCCQRPRMPHGYVLLARDCRTADSVVSCCGGRSWVGGRAHEGGGAS